MAIEAGLVDEVEIVVAPADTADALGNTGVDVLATPRLVALLELAAIRAVEAQLPAGAGTVGTRIDIRHLAATPWACARRSARRSARSTAGASCSTSRVTTRRSGSWRGRTSDSRSTRPASCPHRREAPARPRAGSQSGLAPFFGFREISRRSGPGLDC